MEYTPKFGLGDKVYHIIDRMRPVFIECAMCKGERNITVNGVSARCPECWGRGGHTDWIDEGWRVANVSWREGVEGGPEVLTIGQVRLEHTRGKRAEWQAMCEETGVGSGRLHSMEDFFASLEGAQSECERRNADGAKP